MSSGRQRGGDCLVAEVLEQHGGGAASLHRRVHTLPLPGEGLLRKPVCISFGFEHLSPSLTILLCVGQLPLGDKYPEKDEYENYPGRSPRSDLLEQFLAHSAPLHNAGAARG